MERITTYLYTGEEITLPLDCIKDCSHSGDCYEDVSYWQKELNLNLPEESMRRELIESGMEEDRVRDMDMEELEQYIIWIVANNLVEEIED